ncbi:MAG TPA: hypothetical protein VLT47_11235 [Anaeromyxobacteraceae bacterium]|nr:hypothetical protein [Anaeromyxobacteraceae bacterium]
MNDTIAHPWNVLADVDAAERRANLDDRRLGLGKAFALRREQPITPTRVEALRRREELRRGDRGQDREEELLCRRVEVSGGAR